MNSDVYDSAAIGDVILERYRQVTEEGFSPELDNAYTGGELGKAACAYLLAAGFHGADGAEHKMIVPPDVWPWRANWWKPTDRRRDLVKAAALIVAEIERLDRASARAGQ